MADGAPYEYPTWVRNAASQLSLNKGGYDA
jgi:hypothetical protein